jgi:hypothetical protein
MEISPALRSGLGGANASKMQECNAFVSFLFGVGCRAKFFRNIN